MLLRTRSPAACPALPRHSQRHPANGSGSAAGSRDSRLGGPACKALSSAPNGITSSSSNILSHRPVCSPHASSAGAAVAAAAALHCRLRRRRHAPFSSQPPVRRERSNTAQQLCRCLVDATALPVTAPRHQQQPELRALPAASQITIRPAEPSDYWAIADMHCEAFYPREPPGMMHALLRLDRVLALSVGVHTAAKSKRRRFRCLVACRQFRSSQPHSQNGGSSGSTASSNEHTVQRWQEEFLRHYWAIWRAAIPGPITAGLGADFEQKGIVGAAVVDTLGDHTPPVRLAGGGKRRRPRLAYVSNVAVAAAARRRSIGAMLMQQTEQAAAEWGATAVMLHVDDSNESAVALYRQLQYRLLAEPPRSWLAKAVDVHAGKRMMMKRLRGAIGIGSRRDAARESRKTRSRRAAQGRKH